MLSRLVREFLLFQATQFEYIVVFQSKRTDKNRFGNV